MTGRQEVYKMIGSFLTRGLVMVLGYAYPAYECYKTVEKNKPEIEQLRFWCQYWILVAVLTVCERIGDAFVSWVPMYSEAKLLFIIYLWFPKTKGTTYVYDSFFRPYLAKHENEIDRNLLELRTRAGDIAVVYWQRAASYGQTRIFDILQYVAAQSTPRPRPAQPQQGNQRSPRSYPCIRALDLDQNTVVAISVGLVSVAVGIGIPVFYETQIDSAAKRDNTQPCFPCSGTGAQKCRFCTGTGTVVVELGGDEKEVSNCINCDGVGSFTCTTCQGSGIQPRYLDRREFKDDD
ncbi:hypothetical protein L3X38_006614 [Prunus dulcis]|uniref:HVA22-like protein n=1 Tax=Prunus dulcis TaxID=3755 RepID=A0AAD5F5D9_PRUDU|nr:hypothetical protein L3X38_006614 [Prunus dulcis]